MRETTGEDAVVSESTVERLIRERAWPRLAEELGFSTVNNEVPARACAAWGLPEAVVEATDRLQILAADEGYRLLLAEGVERYADLRGAILAAHRQNRSECVIWWLVAADTITVAVADTRGEGRAFVRRMETRIEAPDPVGLRQWSALAVADRVDGDLADPGAGYRRHVTEVLRQEKMTREFFGGFRDALESLVDGMRRGPDDERARHDVALATLLRLVFLYFLQERGALDGDRRFVLRHYRRVVDEGGAFYGEVLRPLFFEVLNRAVGERSERAAGLGEIPFLNGGLFEPLPAERDHPELGWGNEVWGEIVEGLFERFHFAVDEGTGPDEHRAVDPEMLGKVFEGLMYGERRHESGSFYTPRDVVRKLVADAVTRHVDEETELAHETVRAVVSGDEVELTRRERGVLEEVLRSFHLLDPAVGTGAFLLEALRVVERLYRAAEIGTAEERYRRRLAIMHRHLFGVDIQQTAVRICALRLWLALLSVMPRDWSSREIPPLPNLSHRVACGNSLLAPADRVRLGSVSELPGEWQLDSLEQLEAEHGERMRKIQDRYLEAHGERKVELRREMESLERDLERRLLEARRANLECKLEPYERLEGSRDLFGDEVDLEPAQRREKERIEAELESLREALDDLESDRARTGGFHYAARFGTAMETSGFDVVVTNPPWIRANRLERSTRKLLEGRYRSFSSDLWRGAEALGIRVPFGVQVDVAAVFVERCLELLRPGGHLGALLPAKLFRSLHGSGIRGVLAEHDLQAICDYSESEREMFDATVYPATIHLAKRATESKGARRGTRRSPRAPERSFELSLWRGSERCEWNGEVSQLPARGSDPREPWLLVPPEVSELFDRMWNASRALGGIEALQPSRGVMTGRNEVFVFEESEARDVLGGAAEEWTRPVLSGRDVGAWSVDTSRRILWPYDGDLQIRRDLPDPVREYVRAHRQALESRADHNSNRPLWQLFRVHAGVADPKVVWRDLSPKLEAAPAEPGAIPLNTVYFIPFETTKNAEIVASLFNSEPLRAYAHALAERARGGWRRHFAWVMRMLPIPELVVERLDEGEDGEPQVATELGPSDGSRESWVPRAYGLDREAHEMLRSWRIGPGNSGKQEAA